MQSSVVVNAVVIWQIIQNKQTNKLKNPVIDRIFLFNIIVPLVKFTEKCDLCIIQMNDSVVGHNQSGAKQSAPNDIGKPVHTRN